MGDWRTYRNGNYIVRFNLADGTKIRETEEDDFIPAYAENIDIKITDRCSAGCPFCHEGSTPNGKYGDIMNEKFVDTLHAYQECAIGGGNVLEHPDLVPFLRKLKEKKVIANITVNQIHFEQDQKLIKKLVDEKLVYGIGVSLSKPTENFVKLVKQYPNAVIHTINGILKPSDIAFLLGKSLKILVLGYKQIRRGNEYFIGNQNAIAENQKWLHDNLGEIANKFAVISFDNLAIEQLNVKRFMSDEEWDEFYMGDDAEFTYYIDMVERKFAKNSMAPMDKRYDLLDSTDEMFNKIRISHDDIK